jgi:hypothetical protein
MGFLKVVGVLLLVAVIGYAAFYVGSKITVSPQKHINESKIDDGITMTFVSGTEYFYGDLGKTVIQILDKNQHVLNGTCNQTILYHNSSVFLVSNLSSKDAQGNYYDLFIIPQVSGVYTVNAKCEVPYNNINRTMFNSKTFHVSNATTKILEAMRLNTTQILNNIRDVKNTTLDILNFTNGTYNYLTGHINDHLHNITKAISVVQNNTNTIITLSNSTYNLVYNNVSNSLTQILSLTQNTNTTTINNALDLQLIKDFLGIKPFNISVVVFSNRIVYMNQIWLVQAEVRDQYSRLVINATCILNSTMTGLQSMPLVPQIKRYEYQRKMNVTGDIPFTVSCTA